MTIFSALLRNFKKKTLRKTLSKIFKKTT